MLFGDIIHLMRVFCPVKKNCVIYYAIGGMYYKSMSLCAQPPISGGMIVKLHIVVWLYDFPFAAAENLTGQVERLHSFGDFFPESHQG